jgi:formylglycine-generating enzyme required for sulfatase activity
MGSDPKKDRQLYDNEKPQHRITVGAYRIGTYPVTVAEYTCFVRAGQKEPADWQRQLVRLVDPVVYVSWHDAVAYAAWLAERTGRPCWLPSEGEWQRAAWGTDGRIYPWGDTFDPTRGNTSEWSKGATTPVGAYADQGAASPYGHRSDASP